MHVGSTMSTRPDRPLIVKATFDRYNKRITFSSARNCSYDLLRTKVEQSFSLQAFSFSIAYKDDDGEVTDITSESDLTEAIQYFQAGVDDLPVSSAASILSGRSFGSRRITLRVSVTVDYDGPSLSDTSSLVSLDEYRNRNGSGSSLSLSFSDASQIEPEDDSVTVSSRDTGKLASRTMTQTVIKSSGGGDSSSTVHDFQSVSAFNSESEASAFDERYPADPSAVFERLKLSNSSDSVERNTQWLRDQKSRNNLNGILASESVSDGSLLVLEDDFDAHSPFDGDLALQQDNGKYYYTYRSSSSSSAASAAQDDASISESDNNHRLSDSNPKMRWLASQQTLTQSQTQQQPPASKQPSYLSASSAASSSSSRPSMSSSSSDPLPRSSVSIADDEVPPELLQFIRDSQSPQPPPACTDCSACGILLDSFRYVCSTCGEKTPRVLGNVGMNVNGKGKGRDLSSTDPFADPFSYPPPNHRTNGAPNKPLPPRPLPTVPQGNKNPFLSSSGSHTGSHTESNSSTTTLAGDGGFELCAGCIETAGVFHALAESSGAPDEPSSPEDAQRTLSQLRRAAPKHKGHFRHAYLEKLWSGSIDSGWKDVEQDDTGECTICNTQLSGQRYKCASCTNFVLCRACYSQVHEIHPSHAFLDVPERPPALRTRSEPDLELKDSLNDEDECEIYAFLFIYLNLFEFPTSPFVALVHPDVKCTHCLMDIVGARFHCAICESVDICSNCEAAGLPGNLDADDGGHNSSHIMIKIPIPLNSTKVQTASRRARQLWQGRDAPNVRRTPSGRSRADSIHDADAVTVIGGGGSTKHGRGLSRNGEPKSMEHHILCKGCNQSIVGVRYQCAACPSTKGTAYSLCEKCEPRSYLLHDPMHIFFKLPRPVDRPIESQFPVVPLLYKQPAGPRPGETLNSSHPKAYLSSLHHTAALCDHCMDRISGEWFRCVYCPKDLCDVCENLNAHNPTHFFYVFKAPVDMQLFRVVAELDNPNGSPPVLKYPVYYS
ncbi:uncharacterized protein FOMMEDRAFT_137648 [Fomitiporia mediterranea MF3/22]|uniref:uncharacterized protein n=1 Tax=Fomitiporia mediterranea (strain MF3/22) TaxID=694068 RepID=UPI00044076C0|nr:uncharacterized protein FOMMEDRAFT_137648 [Fomitiporia mediterranea MF3/22]EJD07260.1 hypothetical protein FOMMEDRAFT_137648 [Fomitiporia mediterranea MF3/22]